MKKKIGWLINGHAGTGGGRILIKIANEIMRRGMDITFYSLNTGGIDFMSWVPTLPMEEAEGDIIICSDMGREHLVFNKFRDIKASLKIWYTILWTEEFYPAFMMKDIVKIASTNYFYRQFQGLGATNVIKLIGPADTESFYSMEDKGMGRLRRNNLVLLYLKKCGWTGQEALSLAWWRQPKIVLGGLGLYEIGVDKVKVKCPMVEMDIPSHMVNELNFIFNKSNMYVETCGAQSWGFNYMLAEAMSCKLPVVSTDWEGFDHLVVADETALVVPSDEAPEYIKGDWMVRPGPMSTAEKIVELFDNESLRDRLSKNAYAMVKQYNLEDWVSGLIKVINGA